MIAYSSILKGHEATKKNVEQWAQSFDFSQDEKKDCSYRFSTFYHTVNDIDIYYNYAADYFFFTDHETE